MSENRRAKGVASRKPMSSGENPTRTVIADAHPVFRYGLRRLLESASGFRVIGEASDGAELVKLARQLKPDLVVVDLALPGRSGLEVLCDLVACRPSVRVILTTTTIEKLQVIEAFRLGAHGVVLKGSPPQVLVESIHAVIGGQYWLTQESLAFVVEALREVAARGNGNGAPKDCGLTTRELAIVQRVVGGFCNKDVGRELSVSERTIKSLLLNNSSIVSCHSLSYWQDGCHGWN
jgi:DNA-binding NarL/FixJ family response regulator